jgi:beta-1,4-N-acetylglucosaminyltransferase
MESKKEKQLLVTVGTTKFENLIIGIDTEEFYKLLDDHKFTKLIIQKGFGEYTPEKFKEIKLNNLNVQVEQLLSKFDVIINNSEYIISHGGAGNVLEALQNKKKLFVIVNDLLMDNHQVELVEALSKDNYVFYIRKCADVYKDVKNVLENPEKMKLNEYPNFNLDVIPKVIYEMLEI